MKILFHKKLTVTPIVLNFGLMYNWYAATDARKITSSDDWVFPRYTYGMEGGDFEILADYLGGKSIAGGKLKSTEASYWNAPNTGATNETGFNGRGGGERFSGDGVFYGLKEYVMYWQNCLYDASNGCFSELDHDSAYFSISDSYGLQGLGFSEGAHLRLIKTSTALSDGETGTYTGNDGKIYNTICIGTQEWVAGDLAETKFRNGDLIPQGGADPTFYTNAEWAALITPALCAYNNDWGNV